MIGPERASIRAEIVSTHGQVLEVLATHADFFNYWSGPDQARRELSRVYRETLERALRRELGREGLTVR